MTPTIKVGDRVVADESYYLNHPIQRFDIVIFQAPFDFEDINAKDTRYIKRIIALPDETIEIKKGKVFINGQFLNEPFLNAKDPFEDDFAPLKIPPKEYFLMGDNRANSADSRVWKKPTINQSEIFGKVIEIIPK